MPSPRISKFRDRDLRQLFPCKPVALLSAIALRFVLAALTGARLIAAGTRSMVEDQQSGLRFGGNLRKLFRGGVTRSTYIVSITLSPVLLECSSPAVLS